MVINPHDSEALKRIINYPARGIGATTLSKLEEMAGYYDVSMWQIITNPQQYQADLNKGTLNKIGSFVQLITAFMALKTEKDAYDLALFIANESGLLKDLNQGYTIEERARFENAEELLNGIRDFAAANYKEGQPARLEQFLENVALLTDQDTEKKDDRNKVTLMTIHSAKGLEFPYVYIVGMEEELFPSGMSVHTQHELEEERRLFYVAITRAMHRVCLSYCKSRFKYGTAIEPKPSRFLKEIDAEFIEKTDIAGKKAAFDGFGEKPGTGFRKPARPGLNLMQQRKTPPPPADPGFVPDPPQNIKSGMQVLHAQFGKGKVLQIEGVLPNSTALIFFPDYGEKKLLLRFAKLKIV